MLAALPASELVQIVPALREISLSRGTILHEPDDAVEHVYFPHDVMISLVTVMQDGQGVEVATIGGESALGMASALGATRATARAVVQISGKAARIGAADLRGIADNSPLMHEFAARCSDLLIARLQQSAACSALHRTDARLCRWLLEYGDRAGNVLPVTQDCLAQALGVRRTTVTIMAQILQKANLIYYRRGMIHIVDRSGLERSACECYHAIRQQQIGWLGFSGGELNSAHAAFAVAQQAERLGLGSAR